MTMIHRVVASSSSRSSLLLLRPAVAHYSTTNKPPRAESHLTHPALLRDPPPVTPTDPWSLRPPPLARLPSTSPYATMDQLMAAPHPEGRDGEPVEKLRKRLVYESRKRGILEMDLILSTWATGDKLGGLDEAQLREFDRFMTLPDWSIYYYVTDKATAPEPWRSSWILGELIDHARNEGRKVRRMPDLEGGKQ
ncbi:mitochondrion DUF339 protein [Pseudohyphozyma bogoriensis]|nr:mitochondrion DUF339 protein [Pseudohyphozyma bogoriensis]